MAEDDIMIVDDNPANLKLLEDMLLEQGHDVRSFPLGRLALAAATKAAVFVAEAPPMEIITLRLGWSPLSC